MKTQMHFSRSAAMLFASLFLMNPPAIAMMVAPAVIDSEDTVPRHPTRNPAPAREICPESPPAAPQVRLSEHFHTSWKPFSKIMTEEAAGGIVKRLQNVPASTLWSTVKREIHPSFEHVFSTLQAKRVALQETVRQAQKLGVKTETSQALIAQSRRREKALSPAADKAIRIVFEEIQSQQIIRLLDQFVVLRGASILSVQDKNGQTPAGQAAEQGYMAVLQYIVTRTGKSVLRTPNSLGQTPADIAEQFGHDNLAAYIKAQLSIDA